LYVFDDVKESDGSMLSNIKEWIAEDGWSSALLQVCVVILVVVLGVGFILFGIGKSDPEGAYKYLESKGYTNIVITGFEFGACGHGDYFSTGYTAMKPTLLEGVNGTPVVVMSSDTGVVCGDLVTKSMYVRSQ
jgi:hypothetical protein